jgi:hypothetical protein
MIDVRVALRGIFGLSALLAGGGALASAPTSPQTIVLLHSFDPASEGSYPVPGLTLNSDTNLLWGVLTVPPGGSASTPAPGVLFTMYGFNTVTSTGTTSIASVAIPPLAGSATYYALSFDPNDGSGGGLLFGTSYGDPTLVAGRPQDGAIFQFDPHLGSMAGVLLTSGFTVIQDFNAGGLAGFNDSLGGIGYIRPSSTTYLVGSANDATRFGIYSFPYSTAPSAGSFITSSVGTGFNMSPPVEDPISSAVRHELPGRRVRLPHHRHRRPGEYYRPEPHQQRLSVDRRQRAGVGAGRHRQQLGRRPPVDLERQRRHRACVLDLARRRPRGRRVVADGRPGRRPQ